MCYPSHACLQLIYPAAIIVSLCCHAKASNRSEISCVFAEKHWLDRLIIIGILTEECCGVHIPASEIVEVHRGVDSSFHHEVALIRQKLIIEQHVRCLLCITKIVQKKLCSQGVNLCKVMPSSEYMAGSVSGRPYRFLIS